MWQLFGSRGNKFARSLATLAGMRIVSALFVENFELRQAPGPSTRIDITGAMFSMAAPSPVPLTIDPHLVALIFCAPDGSGAGVFEVVFRQGEGEDDPIIGRNVSPFTVDPAVCENLPIFGEIKFTFD